MTMTKTRSADGTPIAYEITGSGPAIVLVGGAFNDHSRFDLLVPELAPDLTVVTYDRRARGESGDAPAYTIDREIEDLAAVVDLAGGSAAVFGFSSGAMLALQAATRLPITFLFLYEAPFGRGNEGLPERLQALIDAGRPGDAVALFQAEGIGLPAPVIERIQRSPMWPGLVAMAQSTVYDAIVTTELATPTEAMAAVTTPALVMVGAGTWPALKEGAAMVPIGRHVEVPGGGDHDLPPAETAAFIREALSVNNP